MGDHNAKTFFILQLNIGGITISGYVRCSFFACSFISMQLYYTYTTVHACGGGAGLPLVFSIEFANNNHQAGMVRIDQPHTKNTELCGTSYESMTLSDRVASIFYGAYFSKK